MGEIIRYSYRWHELALELYGGIILIKRDNSKLIFHKNTELLGLADKVIYYVREQRYDKALAIVAETIDKITFIVEAIIADRQYFKLVSTESLLEMVNGIINAKKNRDYILLADLYEMQLVNFLSSVQAIIINQEEIIYNEEKYKNTIQLLSRENPNLYNSLMVDMNPADLLAQGYRVEFSSCGLMTLGAENDGDSFYFHTNNRIVNEAFLLANNWFNEDVTNYIIYGFGFGYHITELAKLAKSAKIEIFESDCNVLQLACAFTDMEQILNNPNVSIIYDPEFNRLQVRLMSLTKTDDFKIHYPSYKNIKNRKAKNMLEGYIPWARMLEYC